jgi:uncharacterized protein (TIGR01244 family)
MQLSATYFVCGQISANDLERIAEHGIRSVVNNRPDHEVAGQPMTEDLAVVAAGLGLQYVYIPVVSGRITATDVSDFEQACASLEGPVLLFCRTGARCTELWKMSKID